MFKSHRSKDIFTKVYIVSSIILVISIIFCIFGYVLYRGSSNISIEFLTKTPKGFPIGSEGGIMPAIIGTIYFTLIAVITSGIFAFSASIYHVFYCKNKSYVEFIHRVIGIISGIPSIVLGLFGYSCFVIGFGFKVSLLSGGLVLGIMIFPNMVLRFEKTFEEVDSRYAKNAYALGTNRFYYILKVVLPITFTELLSVITLSASYAMGATAPIILTGAVYYAKMPKSIFSPSMALPVHLYMMLGESISVDRAFATASVLLIILLILNLLSWMLGHYWRKING